MQIFMETGDTQICTFGPTLTPRFSMKMAETEKK